jgi:hypothetical protein
VNVTLCDLCRQRIELTDLTFKRFGGGDREPEYVADQLDLHQRCLDRMRSGEFAEREP